MMKMMRIIVKTNTIKIILITQVFIFATYLISSTFYANLQVAFLSSFFVMLGSFYSYKKMVSKQVETKSFIENRDELDIIDDPHDLYDETPPNEAPAEELDLKQIVKEERAKIKTFDFKSMKDGACAGFSMFRIGAYIFLVLGFISLKNNDILEISVYLPSLLLGVVVGYFTSKEIFT